MCVCVYVCVYVSAGGIKVHVSGLKGVVSCGCSLGHGDWCSMSNCGCGYVWVWHGMWLHVGVA